MEPCRQDLQGPQGLGIIKFRLVETSEGVRDVEVGDVVDVIVLLQVLLLGKALDDRGRLVVGMENVRKAGNEGLTQPDALARLCAVLDPTNRR